MNAALHLAGIDDRDRVLPLVAALHHETGAHLSPEARAAAILPLLQGTPHGCLYLIGPARAPLGYVVVSFGWCVELGGLDGSIDEIYVRPAVRGRGIAGNVLNKLPNALSKAGVTGLRSSVLRDNQNAQHVFARAGFRSDDDRRILRKSL